MFSGKLLHPLPENCGDGGGGVPAATSAATAAKPIQEQTITTPVPPNSLFPLCLRFVPDFCLISYHHDQHFVYDVAVMWHTFVGSQAWPDLRAFMLLVFAMSSAFSSSSTPIYASMHTKLCLESWAGCSNIVLRFATNIWNFSTFTVVHIVPAHSTFFFSA